MKGPFGGVDNHFFNNNVLQLGKYNNVYVTGKTYFIL